MLLGGPSPFPSQSELWCLKGGAAKLSMLKGSCEAEVAFVAL